MEVLQNINNNFGSYQQLISFYEKHKDDEFMNISISIRSWFAANMSSALGAVLDILSNNLNTILFSNNSEGAETILKKNLFLSYYGNYPKKYDKYHTTIPFQKLKQTDGTYFKEYIFNQLLNRDEMPHMSKAARDSIAEAIYEIFVNAQMHSQTNSIFVCGQFFPNKDKIEFTITDVGKGFKSSVNNHFNSNLTSVQAIKWAVQDRHTTKKDTPGGIGLARLSEFIKLNQGKMQIVSYDGFYEYTAEHEKSSSFIGEFPGTVVNLQFNTGDENWYSLKEEVDINDIF